MDLIELVFVLCRNWFDFIFSFSANSSETSNGINQQETGEIVDRGTEQEGIAVRGSFSYTDPATNVVYTVTYIADKNGFQPSAAHLPVGPTVV